MTDTNVSYLEMAEDDATVLLQAYKTLVKHGTDSVRSAWRFGQTCDSFSDAYTKKQLALTLSLSVSTIARYLRLYHAYQRPELAVRAAEALETYNIDLIAQLQDQLMPVEHRSLSGRHFRFHCTSCGSREVHRFEVDDDGTLLEPRDLAEAMRETAS